MDAAMPPPDHEAFLRRSFAVAERARRHGNHPFGAILVGAGGEILLEVENGYLPDRDMTGHAERLLATAASKQFDPKFLADCTLYTSAEPCCMCAGAVYWAGIGRVVYGLSERRLKTITGSQRSRTKGQKAQGQKINRILDYCCKHPYSKSSGTERLTFARDAGDGGRSACRDGGYNTW